MAQDFSIKIGEKKRFKASAGYECGEEPANVHQSTYSFMAKFRIFAIRNQNAEALK